MQCDSEYRSSAGRVRGLDRSVVFLHHRLADAQPKAGSASRPFRGVERIENAGQNISGNPRTIVVKAGPYRFPVISQSNAQRAPVASLANGLLRIQDQVQENLHQLVRIGLHVR